MNDKGCWFTNGKLFIKSLKEVFDPQYDVFVHPKGEWRKATKEEIDKYLNSHQRKLYYGDDDGRAE